MYQDISVNVNGNSNSYHDIDQNAQFATIFNNTLYVVELYENKSTDIKDKVCKISPMSHATVILPLKKPYGYTINWIGTGVDKFRVVFTDYNLMINQALINPATAQNVNITGDAVGLAKSIQLPAALTAGGNLKTCIQEDNVGLNLQATQVSILADTTAILGRLPAAFTAGGGVKVGLSDALPVGTNNIGDIDILTVADGEIVKPGITPNEYLLDMPLANTEYSQALPAGTKKILVVMPSNDTAFRLAFATGKVDTPTMPYMGVPIGGVYFDDNVFLTDKILYAGCASPGKELYVLAWT